MALINCPECGKEVSDTAKACPNCGFKLSKKSRKSIIAVVIGACLIAIIVGVFIIPKLSGGKNGIEITLLGNNEEKEVIIAFYDSFLAVYDDTANGSGKTVESLIDSTREAYSSFLQLNPSDSNYAEYVNNMRNSTYLKFYESEFLNNIQGIDFDSDYLQSMSLNLLHETVEHIVYVSLPFEYDNQLTRETAENDTRSYQAIKGQLVEYANALSKAGVPMECNLEYYVWPESTYSYYTIYNKKVSYFTSIDFNNLSTYAFIIYTNFYDCDPEVNTITFRSGSKQVIFYSTQVFDLDGISDYSFVYTVPYDSDFSESVNNQYYELEALFNESNNIFIDFGTYGTIQLSKSDIEKTRAWFAFYDIMLGYLKE